MSGKDTFSVFDYVIFGLLLAVSAGIGIFFGCFGRKPLTAKELLVANRQMTLFPTAMSLLASFMSGITILGNPAESYQYGTMFWWAGVAYTLTVITTANIFIPIYIDLNITSGYEIIYMALVLYAPALAMNQVTGINIWLLVFSIGGVCTFYTTIGGMKAVMWTDTFQIIIMFIGLLSSLIIGLKDQNGIRNVLEISWKHERIEFFDFSLDPTVRHTVWSCSIGLFFNWLSTYATNQSQVQRYLSVSSAKIAKRALYWNLAGLWTILSLTLTIGLIIFTKYKDCDPLLNKEVTNPEQLYPLFVLQTLNPYIGLPGLFLSCLFSAALSTISSGLNSLSAVFLEDILRGNFKIMSKQSARNEARISKGLCVIFSVICLIVTLIVSFLGNLLQAALSLFGVIGGPILGVFCLGIFVPFSNSIGAISGIISSLAFMFWLFIGYNVYGIKYPKKTFSVEGCPVYNSSYNSIMITLMDLPLDNSTQIQRNGIEVFHAISYTWYGLCAILIVLIVGSVVSLFTKPLKPGQVDPNLIISITDMIPCLPTRLKRYLHFGFEFKYDKELGDIAVHPELKNQMDTGQKENIEINVISS